MQACRHAGVQACRRAGVQVCRRAGVQACMHAWAACVQACMRACTYLAYARDAMRASVRCRSDKPDAQEDAALAMGFSLSMDEVA